MSNENPAGKESTGNDRDQAQTKTNSETAGLNSVEPTEVNGEQMVPLSDVEQVVEQKVAERLDEELGNLIDVRSDSENPGVEDIWIAGQPFGKIIEGNRKLANSAQKDARAAGSSDSEPTGNGGENGSTNDETTLERIADDEQDNPAGVQIGPSVDRAAQIMKHWFDWSDKGRDNRNIRSGLRKLLETATGEQLVWRQVYRACRKVEELTKGKIVFFKDDRHGWMLLQPSSVAKG